ncbi:MAG: hypothetical protein G01um101419_84 [Parcubacteria group bacterium Gr01-1014_19]|nr:MAG: hypothetical protein G01um101419_84 [Parcubacteria group bacterium Gr01-1014_19]
MKKLIWIAGILILLSGIGFVVSLTSNDSKDISLAQINKYDWLLGYRKKLINVKQKKWVGHLFETAILSTNQYKTDGNKDIKFTDSGFYAPSYAMPRSKLLDVNLNQKIKLSIAGTFEGETRSSNDSCTGHCITTEQYNFSEFGIYVIDESGNRQGVRVLGTRDNIIRGNTRNQYKFTSLTVENTGKEIIITDSSGFALAYSPDFRYVTANSKTEENRGGAYGKLNKNGKWFLGINCHVNTVGYCKLDIKDIKIKQ